MPVGVGGSNVLKKPNTVLWYIFMCNWHATMLHNDKNSINSKEYAKETPKVSHLY